MFGSLTFPLFNTSFAFCFVVPDVDSANTFREKAKNDVGEKDDYKKGAEINVDVWIHAGIIYRTSAQKS